MTHLFLTRSKSMRSFKKNFIFLGQQFLVYHQTDAEFPCVQYDCQLQIMHHQHDEVK